MGARILVVDDHEVVREGICRLIEEAGREWVVCGQAGDGAGAITAAMGLRPDLIVLDVGMPLMDGFQAAVELLKCGLSCRILFFTMYDSKSMCAEARRAGVHGYVLKSDAARHLVIAIERLLAGGTFFGSLEPEAIAPPDAPPRSGIAFSANFSFSSA